MLFDTECIKYVHKSIHSLCWSSKHILQIKLDLSTVISEFFYAWRLILLISIPHTKQTCQTDTSSGVQYATLGERRKNAPPVLPPAVPVVYSKIKPKVLYNEFGMFCARLFFVYELDEHVHATFQYLHFIQVNQI